MKDDINKTIKQMGTVLEKTLQMLSSWDIDYFQTKRTFFKILMYQGCIRKMT